MSKITPEEFEERTLAGEFDTDNGGRQPQIRYALREQIRVARALADAPWQAEQRMLTYEDGITLLQIAARLVKLGTRLAVVRAKQSHSAQRRGRTRG